MRLRLIPLPPRAAVHILRSETPVMTQTSTLYSVRKEICIRRGEILVIAIRPCEEYRGGSLRSEQFLLPVIFPPCETVLEIAFYRKSESLDRVPALRVVWIPYSKSSVDNL